MLLIIFQRDVPKNRILDSKRERMWEREAKGVVEMTK
jgi:hypothetical protein